jgi:Ca-activated chloride channel family protein
VKFFYDFTGLWVLLAAGLCTGLLVAFAAMLVLASYARARAAKRFGDPELVSRLETFDSTTRRTWKGVLLILAMISAFVALARPEFGKGSRLVPATNLDIVLVLDYSKSMYARDVAPSRISRAKAEVGRLIHDLPGARFGAIAFAGEPMSFPLTSDGAAIAQFFRQLEPNDMPVGGTATAKALERARELFAHDPKSKDHVRVIVLVTDGEDLEGDPVTVAQACAQEGTRIDVVQIGGRVPEVIPEVGADGKVSGLRHDDQGKLLTSELSAEGEAQLAKIASETSGTIVRAEHGETGIDRIARDLSRMMREELSEKVETVYAEEYMWPLGLALLLLGAEAAIDEAPPSRRKKKAARRPRTPALAVLALAFLLAACGWNPKRPFDREAPEVNHAIRALDGGDATAAVSTLEEYLSTGPCAEGNIGAPDLLRKRPNGTFDLGLSLFKIGETFGRRFGEEELDAGGDEKTTAMRGEQIACALRVLGAVADGAHAADEGSTLELRARARYLEGNLNFLDGHYPEAVAAYDKALTLTPGENDGGDPTGRDAAWNRAIALKRIDDKKDAGPDSGNDGGDAGKDGGDDSGHEGGSEGGGGDSGQKDSGKDSGGDSGQQPDSGGNDAAQPPPDQPDSGPPPPPRANEDERMLDQLESAPTVQQEAAKKAAAHRRVRGMADK